MSNALSLTGVTGALRGADLEAVAERSWGFVCQSLNYSDAFVKTPPELARKIVRRFPGWRKGLSEDMEDQFLLLANMDRMAGLFLQHLADGIPEVADMLEVGDLDLEREVRSFLAMKTFEAKAAASSEGKLALFSEEGYRAAMSMVLRKDQRNFAHEALGRSRKYVLGGGVDENRLREIIWEVWNECYEELLRMGLGTPAPLRLPQGRPAA